MPKRAIQWPSEVTVIGDSRRPKSWHKARGSRVTASQVAVVMGLSKWKTREQLLEEKLSGGGVWEPSQPAWFGLQRERCNLEIFAKLSGFAVYPNTQCVQRKGLECLACTPDAVVGPGVTSVGLGSGMLPSWMPWTGRINHPVYDWEHLVPVDAKNVRAKNEYFWRDGPPVEYVMQMQTDLLVLGRPQGVIVAAFDSDRMSAYAVNADPWTQEAIVAAAESFVRDLRVGRG